MAIDLVARLSLDDQLSKRMGKVTKGVMVGMAAIGVGVGVAITKFVEFDDQIRKAGAIAGATATELNAMKEAAIDMGAKTSKNATEVAESMAELAAKGFDANQTIAAMPGIIAASEASGESLAIAADTVASALNIWGLEAAEAGHVADVLAMAANVSAAGIEDLQQAFKYAGAPAAALGISMEEVAASIGIMTDSGIAGGSAGTSLRASLLALNNPAKAQAKIMNKLGFSITDSAGEAKSLSQIVGELAASTKDMTDADKVATVAKLVGTEAVSGFLALMKAGPAHIDKMTNALENSDGAAAETAAKMMAGIGGALEALGGAIDSFALRIGDKLAPYITLLANKLSDVDIMPFISGFNKAVDVAESFAKAIASGWGAIKGVVMPIVKALITFGVVIATLAVGISTFAALGTAIAFLLSPIGLIALGITGLVLKFQDAYKTSEPFRKSVDTLVGSMKGLFAIFTGGNAKGKDVMLAAGLDPAQIEEVYAFADKMRAAFATFGDLWPSIKEGLIGVAIAVGTFKAAVVGLTVINTVVTAIKAWRAATVGMTLAQALLNAVLAVNPIILIAMAIAGLATVGVLLYRNWDTVTTATKKLWDSIGGLKGAMAIILGPIGFLINAAMDLAKNWDSTKSVWENVWSAIQRSAATSINAVIGLINEMIGVINKIPGVNIPIVAKVDWGAATPQAGDFRKLESASMNKGKSNYHGIDYVAKNNTAMDLHRGEAVLTAAENKARKQGGSGGITINMNGVTVRENADIDRIADQLYRKIHAAGEAGA